jgi:hypothetical protein
MDVSFREDHCRIRKGHGPENFATLRRMALSLLKQAKSRRTSIKSRRKICGWDHDFLLHVLTGGVEPSPS